MGGEVRIKWNDFPTIISHSFSDLCESRELVDITLVCQDNRQLQAHKVVLAACSPFFRSVLVNNPHHHPLLYLKDIKIENLQSVIKFIYQGEVKIKEDELTAFLAVAEELEIKCVAKCPDNDDPIVASLEPDQRDYKLISIDSKSDQHNTEDALAPKKAGEKRAIIGDPLAASAPKKSRRRSSKVQTEELIMRDSTSKMCGLKKSNNQLNLIKPSKVFKDQKNIQTPTLANGTSQITDQQLIVPSPRKQRGRLSKVHNEQIDIQDPTLEEGISQIAEQQLIVPSSRRGRPSKVHNEQIDIQDPTSEKGTPQITDQQLIVPSPRNQRGRPSKVHNEQVAIQDPTLQKGTPQITDHQLSVPSPKTQRGRPSNAHVEQIIVKNQTAVKGIPQIMDRQLIVRSPKKQRGRPSKVHKEHIVDQNQTPERSSSQRTNDPLASSSPRRKAQRRSSKVHKEKMLNQDLTTNMCSPQRTPKIQGPKTSDKHLEPLLPVISDVRSVIKKPEQSINISYPKMEQASHDDECDNDANSSGEFSCYIPKRKSGMEYDIGGYNIVDVRNPGDFNRAGGMRIVDYEETNDNITNDDYEDNEEIDQNKVNDGVHGNGIYGSNGNAIHTVNSAFDGITNGGGKKKSIGGIDETGFDGGDDEVDDGTADQDETAGKGSKKRKSKVEQDSGNNYFLDGHLQLKEDMYTCILCQKKYSQKSSARSHLETCHFPDMFVYSCHLCTNTFNSRNKHAIHMSTKHRKKK